jgi:hypothetical protein
LLGGYNETYKGKSMKIFSIAGYFKDDPTDKFNNFLVTEYDCTPEGRDDDEFFFHGLSEKET